MTTPDLTALCQRIHQEKFEVKIAELRELATDYLRLRASETVAREVRELLSRPPMVDGQLLPDEFQALQDCRQKSVVIHQDDFNIGFQSACWFYRNKFAALAKMDGEAGHTGETNRRTGENSTPIIVKNA